eukprot:scaffold6732_cov68-Cyclotella_meneghiniana.AAC.5
MASHYYNHSNIGTLTENSLTSCPSLTLASVSHLFDWCYCAAEFSEFAEPVDPSEGRRTSGKSGVASVGVSSTAPRGVDGRDSRLPGASNRLFGCIFLCTSHHNI